MCVFISYWNHKKLLNYYYQHVTRIKKANKLVALARSKLNSIESTISKALTDNEIRCEDFTTITNEETNYRGLKERFRITKS